MTARAIRLPRPAGCIYSERHAQRAVDFFRHHLRHTKGRWAGQPFQLRPWQEIDIREIFGRVDEAGNRVIRQVYIEEPKKNGKSELVAGIALKLLFADSEIGAEIYGAAADRDQASIVFDVAAQMVRSDPALLKAAGGLRGVVDSRKRIIFPQHNSFYRVVSSELYGKHGYNASGVIFDEIHAQRDTRLWEALTFGSGAARTQPLTVAITTAGVPGESPVAEALHADADQMLRGIAPAPPSFYPVMYGVDDKADPWSEDTWYEANPALGDFLSIESVREEADRARRRPSEQNSFRRLRLNQWVSQRTRWIDMDVWDGCSTAVDIRELRHLTWYGGLDLSSKQDLTAFVLVAIDGNDRIWVVPKFWVPKDTISDRPNLEAHRYWEWIKQGVITACPGNEIEFASVKRAILEASKDLDLADVGYDRQFANQLAQELTAEGLTMTHVPQTYSHYTEPCMELETALLSRRVCHGGHPVLRWMADCVTVIRKDDGTMKPVKDDRLKSPKRVDGVVAMLMAIGRAMVGTRDSVSYSGWKAAGASNVQ